MRNWFWACTVVVGVVLTGCAPVSQTTAPPPPNVAARPDVPAWHDRYDMPWELDPQTVPFVDQSVRESFLKCVSAAKQLTKQGEIKLEYLYWNSGSDGYRRKYQWTNGEGRVSLSTELYDRPRNAHDFQLLGRHQHVSGWTASLDYYRSAGHGNNSMFSVEFSHPQHLPRGIAGAPAPPRRGGDPGPVLRLGPGQQHFSAYRVDQNYRYSFSCNSRSFIRDDSPRSTAILQYWQSAEEFRKAADTELDHFEENCRQQLAKAVSVEVTTHGGPTGGDVPHPVTVDNLPESITTSILDEAVKEISRRRKLVADHFQEMHAAMIAVFPEFRVIVDANQ